METLDAIDLKILTELQQDCKLTTKELAAKVHLSTTPTFERVKRLESEGLIRKYIALLDAEKLNKGFIVFCNVKLKHINKEIAENFARSINNIPEVSECYNISGDFDYFMKIHCSDMKYYHWFIINVLGTLDEVSNIQSVFVMEEVKCTFAVPIN
jgi:Lrp/AsnC family leucine-responsive transcriptional regulator